MTLSGWPERLRFLDKGQSWVAREIRDKLPRIGDAELAAFLREMLERRVNVGIGTDGANCSDNLNMYEAMRLASFASKAQGPDLERWVTGADRAAAAE